LNKISIFEQNFNFWTKFQFLNKISIFEQNFNCSTEFKLLIKISILEHHFIFLTNILILEENFHFWTKLLNEFLNKGSILFNKMFEHIFNSWTKFHFWNKTNILFFQKNRQKRKSSILPAFHNLPIFKILPFFTNLDQSGFSIFDKKKFTTMFRSLTKICDRISTFIFNNDILRHNSCHIGHCQNIGQYRFLNGFFSTFLI